MHGLSASGWARGSYAIPGFGKYAWVWKAFGPVCGRYASLRKRAWKGLGQMKNAVEGAGRLRKRVRLTALQKTSRRRKACGQQGFALAENDNKRVKEHLRPSLDVCRTIARSIAIFTPSCMLAFSPPSLSCAPS